jgi:hypothetical protein
MTPTATVSQVKTGLKNRLDTITNFRAYDNQPDQLNPGIAGMGYPSLNNIIYHGAMGAGLVTMQFTVTCIISRQSERTAQNVLDALLGYGTGSIRYAIESESTLGGIVNQTVVESADNILTVDANDTQYFTVDFRVTVYA